MQFQARKQRAYPAPKPNRATFCLRELDFWVPMPAWHRAVRPGSELFLFEQQHCSHARVVVLYLGAGFPKAPGIQEWNWNAAQSALHVARGLGNALFLEEHFIYFFLEKYATARFSQPLFIPEIWSFPISLIT